MQQLAGGIQVAAAGQFEGDGGQAGQCRDADHQQDQPGIFIFDFGDAPDVGRLGSHGQPGHQHQVGPDADIPADQDFADDRVHGNQDTYRQAKDRGAGQTRVGAGEEGHGDSLCAKET